MRRSAEVFLLDIWKATDYIIRRTAGIDHNVPPLRSKIADLLKLADRHG